MPYISKKRDGFKARSNNKVNQNKNICGLAVATAFGVDKNVHYLHTMNDIVRAVRTKFVVRSRLSRFKGKTVGGIRKDLEKKCVGASHFIVGVKGHVLLLDHLGNTIVDTAPRKKDKRKVTELYAVYTKDIVKIAEQLGVKL